MIAATRRHVLAGALATPVLALPRAPRAATTGPALLLHDASTEAGRRAAQVAHARGDRVQAIEGDRVRLARAVFAAAPGLVIGVSRPADALLIEDVAREAGLRPVALGSAWAELATTAPDRGLVLVWALAPHVLA